jgi:hypothetical protein
VHPIRDELGAHETRRTRAAASSPAIGRESSENSQHVFRRPNRHADAGRNSTSDSRDSTRPVSPPFAFLLSSSNRTPSSLSHILSAPSVSRAAVIVDSFRPHHVTHTCACTAARLLPPPFLLLLRAPPLLVNICSCLLLFVCYHTKCTAYIRSVRPEAQACLLALALQSRKHDVDRGADDTEEEVTRHEVSCC